MPEPKSRRIPKPIWFGVAAVLMMVLAVFLQVWLPYHREQVAIREIEEMDAYVNYNRMAPEWLLNGRQWLRKKIPILSDEWIYFFDRAYLVDLSETAVSDEELRLLNSLANLEDLDLGHTEISDKGAQYLNTLTNLEFLNLDNTRVSDEGMKNLTGMTNLFSLSLDNTRVSDEGLKSLNGLTNLYYLWLENTQVTDEGVKELQKALPNCEISY